MLLVPLIQLEPLLHTRALSMAEPSCNAALLQCCECLLVCLDVTAACCS